jgi:mono/diheme cytochrome c family protein
MVAARGGGGLLLLSATSQASAEGDVETGREVAEAVCARCHMGTAKPYGGIDSTPTFFFMSEQLDEYRQRVLTLKARRPHKALDLDPISNGDPENLAAWIGTLERR